MGRKSVGLVSVEVWFLHDCAFQTTDSPSTTMPPTPPTQFKTTDKSLGSRAAYNAETPICTVPSNLDRGDKQGSVVDQ